MTDENKYERMLDAAERSRQEEAMAEAEDYLARGRRFSEIPNDELPLRWTSAYRWLAQNPLDSGRMKVHNDLTTECKLRGMAPPYSDEDLNLFMDNLKKASEQPG